MDDKDYILEISKVELRSNESKDIRDIRWKLI
jgi:hypothetical protein